MNAYGQSSIQDKAMLIYNPIDYLSYFLILQASNSNARPLQATNKRPVYLYRPKVKSMKN